MAMSTRRVLVTGGAGGVGTAVVSRFMEAGATVFALDFDQEALQGLKTKFPNVNTVLANLEDWEATKKAVEAILPIHHLVNNAAVFTGETLLETIPEQLDRVFAINFKAAYNLTQVFARGIIGHKLEQEGGTIVNISSLADRVAPGFGATYSCSKASLSMLTRATAIELGQYGIRANTVRPTAMKTALYKDVVRNGAQTTANTDKVTSRAALKAQLEPEDVAKLVYFLSSPDSSLITGENVAIDGGISAA